MSPYILPKLCNGDGTVAKQTARFDSGFETISKDASHDFSWVLNYLNPKPIYNGCEGLRRPWPLSVVFRRIRGGENGFTPP